MTRQAAAPNVEQAQGPADFAALFARWDAMRANVETDAWYEGKGDAEVAAYFAELNSIETAVKSTAALSVEFWAIKALMLLRFLPADECPEHDAAAREALPIVRRIMARVAGEGATNG